MTVAELQLPGRPSAGVARFCNCFTRTALAVFLGVPSVVESHQGN